MLIQQFALDRLPRSRSTQLYAAFSNFEKQFGDRSGIETTVLGKRRIQYEEELAHESRNYDVWFDYARLEEDAYKGDRTDEAVARVREVYERAVAQVPPSDSKRHWRRYIFTWLNYALFEELETKVSWSAQHIGALVLGFLLVLTLRYRRSFGQDLDRAREIYRACLKLIPHKSFTFAKAWTQFAEFELRQLDLEAARKIMGTAIGMAPKEKVRALILQSSDYDARPILVTDAPALPKQLFKKYIDMELNLREFDRCRALYQKWLEVSAGEKSCAAAGN